jgi:hypothetical protein
VYTVLRQLVQWIPAGDDPAARLWDGKAVKPSKNAKRPVVPGKPQT